MALEDEDLFSLAGQLREARKTGKRATCHRFAEVVSAAQEAAEESEGDLAAATAAEMDQHGSPQARPAKPVSA